MWISLLDRNEEFDGLDPPRPLLAQDRALPQGFSNQAKLKVFEVSQSTMNQTSRAGTGSPAKILRFNQSNLESALNCISGNSDPIDATAKD